MYNLYLLAEVEAPLPCRPDVKTYDEIRVGDCISRGAVNISFCAGTCDSTAIAVFEEQGFLKPNCSCCQPTLMTTAEFDFDCTDSSGRTEVQAKTYYLIETCKCMECGWDPLDQFLGATIIPKEIQPASTVSPFWWWGDSWIWSRIDDDGPATNDNEKVFVSW